MASNPSTKKYVAHAVCVPFAAQGHINPMMKLAKLLHQNGFHITFVNTEYNHRRLLKSRGPESLTGIPTFRFETIPDGLPWSDADSTQDVPSLCNSTQKTCLGPFKALLAKLKNDKIPSVSCIVSDCIMSFTLEAAKEIGIPNVLLWTSSASSYLAYFHHLTLRQKGLVPLKDESYLTNGYLDTVIDWLPGMEGICLKNLPSFLRTTDPDDIMFNFALEETRNACNASALLFNTFDELDHDVLNAISSLVPQVFSIGPIQLLQNKESELNSIGSNLWKEQRDCLDWLDTKEPGSVIYVNFGSVTVMTTQQLVEFAWGLANSKKTFLWVIRPDLVVGESAIVPEDFLAETRDRVMLAGWCPQEKVLGHPSIGGFLTHSGWNSTMESLSSGVPMICWPFFADQQTNSWFCSEKWGIGMEIDNNVKRDAIERMVRELMEGEKGKEMKKRSADWKRMAGEAAANPTGSSYLNFVRLLNEVLLPQSSHNSITKKEGTTEPVSYDSLVS